MEASQAGLAGGGDAAQGQQGEGQADQQNDGMSQQLEALKGSQEELRQFLMAEPWRQGEQGQEQGEPADAELDLSFLDDPAIAPEQQAAQLQDMIRQEAQRQAQELVGPLSERLTQREFNEQARDLVSEFPEMGQQQVADEVVGTARQIADANGWPAEIAGDPRFWRLTYMAGRAADSANQEGAESPGAAHLESGSGAGPAGGSEVDLGEQIVSARRGRSVLPFG